MGKKDSKSKHCEKTLLSGLIQSAVNRIRLKRA